MLKYFVQHTYELSHGSSMKMDLKTRWDAFNTVKSVSILLKL